MTYVTFVHALATNAKRHMLDMMKLHNHGGKERKAECITASTLHSCAMQLVNIDKKIDETNIKKGITNDYALQGIIVKEFLQDIES